MPAEISNKEAKKAEALARAKQWRDARRDNKSPSSQATEKRCNTTKPAKKARTTKATSTTPKKATATEEVPATNNVPDEQYRKTPSRANRAKALGIARAKAKDWSEKRKEKSKTSASTEESGKSVPNVVETSEVESEVSDDFQTAAYTENRTQTGSTIDEYDVKELNLLKQDVKNLHTRLHNLCDKFSAIQDGGAMD